jgi:hypothetical protein
MEPYFIYSVRDLSMNCTMVRAISPEEAQSKFETWRDLNLPDAIYRSVYEITLIGTQTADGLQFLTPNYID